MKKILDDFKVQLKDDKFRFWFSGGFVIAAIILTVIALEAPLFVTIVAGLGVAWTLSYKCMTLWANSCPEQQQVTPTKRSRG